MKATGWQPHSVRGFLGAPAAPCDATALQAQHHRSARQKSAGDNAAPRNSTAAPIRAGERFCPRTAEAGFIGTTWPVMSQSNSEHADSSERALALQDALERAIEGPGHNAGARRDSGDHNEEAHLVHRAPEAAEPAGDEIADEAGAEPQAHHHRDHARRRNLRN
ncbi:MAG: hypothetical protein DLM68_07870 [Hyphomicrobiales bacterium]|nr:MAG: hypothetical protein DLM68_07870 [Hyphomicrobiales bacterium]